MVSYLQDGWTALHKASQEGHVDVVRVLIDANAHVNQQTTVLSVSIAKLAVFICSNTQSPHIVSVYPSSVNSCSIPFASLPALPSPPVLSFYPSITMSHHPSSVPPQILTPFPSHTSSFPSSCPPTLPSSLSAIILPCIHTEREHSTLLGLMERPCGSSSAAAPETC